MYDLSVSKRIHKSKTTNLTKNNSLNIQKTEVKNHKNDLLFSWGWNLC